MRLRSLTLLSLSLLAVALRGTEAPLADVIRDAFAQSGKQYDWMLAHLPADEKKPLPRTFENGKLVTIAPRDWTSGFFPGSLWYLYEATGDAKWRASAEKFTALLESQKDNKGTHDVGFILYCSFGNGLRLTKNPAYRDVLLQGAKSLETRFSPVVGTIKSWDWSKEWSYPVIIDNMMNLELLMWAGDHGDAHARAIAIKHADTTLKNHFRPDGSTFHVVNYDANTGAVLKQQTHQGAADDSSWARGQGWALYGYTLMYRETKDGRYLAQAQKTAEFIMNHPRLPADKIPYWDFDAPDIPKAARDASAGALICSALYELSGYVEAKAGAKYAAFAEAQLRSLASPQYLAAVGDNGGFLIKHCTGNAPKNSEVDVPLNYGDYYFLEALLRAKARSK
jgi:hypothetical protein